MNVKEMLLTCNIEKAAQMHYVLQEPPKCDGWEGFLQAHKDFAVEIAGIQPIPGEYVILGSTAVADGKPYHTIRMYSTRELLENFRRCEDWEDDRPPEAYSDTELEHGTACAQKYGPMNHYDMELMPWEKLLGVEIFEDNLHTVGHDLLAALVIREMSFWGLRYDCSRQGQNGVWVRLQEAMQDLDEMIPFESVEEALEELKSSVDEEDGETPALCDAPGCDTDLLVEDISPAGWARIEIAIYRELLRFVSCNNCKVDPIQKTEGK